MQFILKIFCPNGVKKHDDNIRLTYIKGRSNAPEEKEIKTWH
nr:MAG TPA: hypothetical protein [Caudoviricetes sp.]